MVLLVLLQLKGVNGNRGEEERARARERKGEERKERGKETTEDAAAADSLAVCVRVPLAPLTPISIESDEPFWMFIFARAEKFRFNGRR